MSRQRRPSRAETRARLLDAAVRVFVERGIAAASVDEIAEAAGFSRGALYSNFADKDALVLALLERTSHESEKEVDDLLAAHPDPDDFIRATQAMLVAPNRRDGMHHPVLSIELMLYALRNPAARPLLKARLDRAESAIVRVVEASAENLGLAPADNRRAIAAMVVAMDDGFGLHAMIDPTRDPLEAFNVALDFLAEAGAAIAVAEQIGKKRTPTRPAVRARRNPLASRLGSDSDRISRPEDLSD